jgi:hypothetical protein
MIFRDLLAIRSLARTVPAVLAGALVTCGECPGKARGTRRRLLARKRARAVLHGRHDSEARHASQLTYHGVLAPAASWRSDSVPAPARRRIKSSGSRGVEKIKNAVAMKPRGGGSPLNRLSSFLRTWPR